MSAIIPIHPSMDPNMLIMRFTDNALFNTLVRAQISFRCRRFGLKTVVGVEFVELLHKVRSRREGSTINASLEVI
jgi:hypothetical protein